ncbi:MAG: GNAT family N-acetyltransferase [Sphingomonadales bacterium]|jgi:RimJ/RimL family protein N-acetyltransferase|nr:GNAT family N-acetyltransferase [Sphingomonadales bacterium]MBK9004983.1 GNAT family N-acetyltransferase [Sphingomonadales bacterium]MBK9267284.1 GNAT family N-acetyltransferase [Sphingomonadales bacterium]MBP6434319.1 GNAT family N-acetyltransferase [Sphingorhabdus sp.]
MAGPWTEQPVLEGRHVRLRPMVRTDGPAIVEAASDGRLWELFYTAVPGPDSIDSYLDRAEREQEWGRVMPFVVIEKVTGEVVGATRYMRMNAPHRRLEIGTTFYAARAQHTPVNSEAKLLLLTHAFEVMDCVCVQFRTDHFNFASQRAIERLGAKRDGLLRNHSIMDGRVRDTVVYSILANEWEGVKRNLVFRLERA